MIMLTRLLAASMGGFVLFMFLCFSGILRFSDASVVHGGVQGTWTEYDYFSKKTGTKCGAVYSGKWTHPDDRATGYAYTTQWWNLSMSSRRNYASIADARRAIEKLLSP